MSIIHIFSTSEWSFRKVAHLKAVVHQQLYVQSFDINLAYSQNEHSRQFLYQRVSDDEENECILLTEGISAGTKMFWTDSMLR